MSDVVVVGYVPTREGDAALAVAVEEAQRRDGRLLIVHSSKGGTDDGPDSDVETRLALDARSHQLAQDGLDVKVEEVVTGGHPANDLIDVAEREQAALIVIGLRRRSPVGKLLMGSKAQTILLNADCPVLAVKAD